MSSRPVGVHLVGSVPLSDAEEVFRVSSEVLGERLRRITDGETGERLGWIHILLPILEADANLEKHTRTIEGFEEYGELTEYGLREGASAEDVDLSGIGYAGFAAESYPTFRALRDEGVIPPGTRFQVGMPTPACAVSFIRAEDKLAMEAAFRTAMLADLAAIAAEIPAEDLAIQWESPIETLWLAGGMVEAHFPDMWGGTVERFADLLAAVPAGVDAGLHFCVGDWGHMHQVDLDDCSLHVRLANEIAEVAPRPWNFLHIPIHRDRDPEAYCSPLADLRLPAETELFLGLVHLTDGVDGTQRRIDVASRYVDGFGVATECGFGRRPPETVRPLLDIHRAVSDPYPASVAT